MNRLYTPSQGVHTWRERLAEPTLHWKQGASAMELAIAWELAARTPRGLPESVARVLDAHPTTKEASLLFGFPEHQVPLAGGSRPSQTDLWAVLKSEFGLVSLAVEGKAREPFGPTIDEWLREPTAGKRVRLAALCATLGVETLESSVLRYQLFHRAASAVLEAGRIGARTAVLLVQSFSPVSTAWADFEAFALLFGGAAACRDGICEVQCPAVDQLLFAWVDSPVATTADVALANANEVR